MYLYWYRKYAYKRKVAKALLYKDRRIFICRYTMRLLE